MYDELDPNLPGKGIGPPEAILGTMTIHPVRRTWALELIWSLHRWIYRLSGGRFGIRLMGHPVLLLSTSGRRTGEQRYNTLYYFEDGDGFIVIASNAGEQSHPAWYLNLKANPEVIVQVGSSRSNRIAREITGDARTLLWQKVVDFDPVYQEYQEGISREIPLISLEKMDPEPT